MRKALLAGGVASSLLYATLTVVAAARWPQYSSSAQTVSELSAVGAPTRTLWVPAGVLYTVLVTGFGWGVWKSAGSNRKLCAVGILIVVYGALGVLWPFAAMHSREVLAANGRTWSDTLHIALAAATVTIMLIAIAIAAATGSKPFRWYSIVSLGLLAVFGALTFADAPRIGANLPTPWVGVWERVNIGVFLLWIIVLAAVLWRTDPDAGRQPVATLVQD